MAWAGPAATGVIGQKNIVAYVNYSNTHRGHSHSLTHPTGDIVSGNTFTRDAFRGITHPQKTSSEPTTPTEDALQTTQTPRIVVQANKYRERHCHSNTHPLETLSQSTYHLGDTSSELPVHRRCPRDLTLTGGCVAITLTTHSLVQPIGDTLLGNMLSELSQLLNSH